MKLLTINKKYDDHLNDPNPLELAGAILCLTDKEIAVNFLGSIALCGHAIEQSDIDQFRQEHISKAREFILEEGLFEETAW